MKDFLKSPLFVLTMTIIVIVLLVAYTYLLIFNPLVAEKERLEKKEKVEQTLLTTAKSQVSETANDAVIQIKSLHDKVPAKPYVGQFLFSIEKAKVISDSEILEMNVTESVTEGTQWNKITVSMAIVSPNYFEMQSFLNSLEANKRITTIDSLSFSEESFKDETTGANPRNVSPNQVYYNVTVSSYYFPQYKDVVDSLPMQEMYNVGNKENPLAQ